MNVLKASFLALFLSVPALAAAPRVEFKETEHDFGLLTQGTTVQYSFSFKNAGDAPLEVQSVNTSCGCTAAVAGDKVVPPGGASRIDVTYDSRGKLGDVDKQVRVWTNDPKNPRLALTVRGKVVPSAHPEMTGTDNLFKGNCASCHADRAQGKTGESLYNAACAMCHERAARGEPRIAASAGEMSALSRGDLVKAISLGRGSTSMPGFARKRGGPLDSKQIKSLADFIREMKEK